MEYKPPRPLSIAVTNQEQYLLGHKRGWDDASERIAELEVEVDKLECLVNERDSFVTELEDEIDSMLRDRY